MSNYLLVDYLSVKPGDLPACAYPSPVTVVIFAPAAGSLAIEDVNWLLGMEIQGTVLPVLMSSRRGISTAIGAYCSSLFSAAAPGEILLVSQDRYLDIIASGVPAGLTARRFSCIAELPTLQNGNAGMSPKVKGKRAAIMAIFVAALFVALLVSFLFVIKAYTDARELVLDLGAYVLPGIGAFCAGIALFFKRAETALYFASAGFVIVGFLCYMYSKEQAISAVPGEGHALVHAALWGVFSVSAIAFAIALWCLDVVTHGPWRTLNCRHRALRTVYFLTAVGPGVAVMLLGLVYINMLAYPSTWTTQGPFQLLGRWTVQLLG